jgi:cation transport ATPase
MMGRTIAWALSLLLLLFTGVVGIYNGVVEWGEAATPMQQSVTVGVFLYGVFGLITAYGLLRRRRWTIKTAVAWAIPIAYVPGVAVMAYAEEGAVLGSAIAASVGSAIIALGVLWAIDARTRPREVAANQP